MKYIKRIRPIELNAAFKKYMKVADVDDLWEVNGTFASPGDLCFKTIDNNCYYMVQPRFNNNFVYFAFEKNRLINMKGLWESLIEIVKLGNPYIRFSGRHNRYRKIMKGFCAYWETHDAADPTYEAFMCYVAHPDNIEKIKRRINK